MIATRARLVVALVASIAIGGCGQAATSGSRSAGDPAAGPSTSAAAVAPRTGSLVLVGRIVTLDEPAIGEALYIEDGLVAAVGTRGEVQALAGDAVPVVDLGQHVAYPGFVDAHTHWIGDREYYEIGSAEAAIDAAIERGWTSISEHWVNPERLDELETLAADAALPMRVDAYLALNYDQEFFGDWYTAREPGAVDDHLMVKGLKIHLDDGSGKIINWEPADLTATIGRANEAGWQVAIHAMSTTAQDMVLDAFESAIGPMGPNPLHHRVEHALQVTDDQLARLVSMDIGVMIHLDGAADWLLFDDVIGDFDRDDPGEAAGLLARWRDFIDAGLHVASSTDAPWTFPDLKLTDGIGRPVDHIAAGMDGRVRSRPDTPAWLLDQPLTAEQGLRAVTADAAWLLGDESRRGHLAPGTLGDVTILSGDVSASTPDEIRAMSVIATIVGGVPVYCADPRACP